MKIKTPQFWYQPRGWISTALLPFAGLYALGRTLHARKKPEKTAIKVICIGNLVAGGSGKTPAARALMALLRPQFKKAFFLTRGYGRDESRLLERDAPTIITADRPQGLQDAARRGADLVIMDDGFQNPHIRATLNFVVIDGAAGFGNECLLPAGPLREPLQKGLARADAFILIGEDRHKIRNKLPADKPVFTAQIKVTPDFNADKTIPYVGFAGLGRPEKFLDTLRQYGLNVVHFIAYPDHHPYRQSDINKLLILGRRLSATLITTEKDAMRLPKNFTPLVLPITLHYDSPADILEFIRGHL